ncbi:MAG: hypothetical protein JWN83_1884 [Chitinophagaceae bacterium]|nr:hypothetical protein [Chitinophagaceae bacterium]
MNAQVLSVSQTSSTITTANLPAANASWSNAANASAANNAFTTVTLKNRKHSNLLVATNWGITLGAGANQIPSNAVINGIEVQIKMKGSNNSMRDYVIQLRKNSSISSNNLSRTNSAWPQTLTYVKFGSSTNMWGLSWTPAEIAASTFGVEIAALGRTAPGTAMIDHIKITVYFNLRYYYSKSAGYLTTLGTWGVNTDGSGAAPLNFSDSGQIFFLRNRAAVTLNANLTIAGEASKMVIGDGTNVTALTIPSTATLNALVDVAPNGTLNIANITSPTLGSLDNNSTVNYNAAANQTVQELTYYHLSVGGSGTKTSEVTGNAITVNGNFTISSGVIFDNNDQDVGINGDVINSGTTTGSAFIWMAGIAASTISGTNGVFSNLKIDNDLSVALASAQTITDTLNLTSQPFTVGSSLNLNTGAIIVRDDGTLSAAPTGSNLYDIQYIGVTKTTGAELSSSFIRNFKLSLVDTLPNTLTLAQALTVSGYLQLDSGTLDASAGNYNITVNKNVIANSTLNNRSNTFTLNGTALQTISGSNAVTFYRLTLNNTAGLRLQNSVQVNNLLTFTSGLITTDNTNKLTLGSAATTSGAGTAKYINGPLAKIFASISNNFIYPVGKAGLYRPVTLDITQLSATATTYTTEMVNSTPPAATLPSSLSSVSPYRYFTVSKGAGASVGLASVTLSYDTEDAIVLPANTKIAQRVAGIWVDLGGAGTGSPSGNVRSANNFTSFNEFALADNTAVLPVSLVSFKGTINNGIVKLQWVTGNEMNIDHYEIEKSASGLNWNTAGTTQAINIAQLQNSYMYNDKDPYTGKSYYRLKIIDKNQAIKYSDVISLFNSNPEKPKITIRPSLTDSKQSSIVIKGISFDQNERIILKIFNSNGTLVINKVCTAQEQLPLDFHNLSGGMYVMATEIKGIKYNLPFIIW